MMKFHNIDMKSLSSLWGKGFLLTLTVLLGSCRSETQKCVDQINEKCPLEVSGGNLLNIDCDEDGKRMDWMVEVTTKDYDFDILNQNPEVAKDIRGLQLSAYGDKTLLGHMLRLAQENGYTIDMVYMGTEKDDNNTVRFTPADLKKVIDRSSTESAQLLSMRVSINYINLGLPHTIDDITTQDKAYFDNGTVVVHFTLDEEQLDWNAIMAHKEEFRKSLQKDLQEECRKNQGQTGLFRQCIAGGYSFAYEYEGTKDKTHVMRLTFTPEEIKKMLTLP